MEDNYGESYREALASQREVKIANELARRAMIEEFERLVAVILSGNN